VSVASDVRLADDLRDSYERFCGAVEDRARELGETTSLPLDARAEAAAEFLEVLRPALASFMKRYIEAANHSRARDEELG
jgi:hypothetical protein